ncbi:GNAT family N-acetyltransferase [Flavobacterium ranwuense]|uniref:GNAT family N-acetyltransferase n=1 Tax=Flavobacterium ranwuense TaxID=2541725 RepID=A0ABY2DTH2_9FLAO|nr:GNAT family N-acetyltransferase [Flavobacterium ranwuense]TDE29900.1 GNAT family N-acetyltransferase [Flavobacterium ranwuense]
MKNYSVKQYQKSDYTNWNAFIGQAKNATFLFHRDFMEYHKDRFGDFSLMIFENEKLVAVLPANKVGEIVYSHQGLTYGGLVSNEQSKLTTIINAFRSVLLFLEDNKIEKLHLKTIPSIYHTKPAEEIQYALFLAEAKLVRRDSLSVIDLSQKYDFSKIRKRGIKKGMTKGLVIKEETNFESFWDEVLIPNLEARHNAKPVHSIAEMNLLKSRFPNNIRQFNVYHNDQIVAGTTVFESEAVAHCQYISKYENVENLGSLDFLYHFLITDVFVDKRFFDFGISNETQGKLLNDGLSYWKESFGASTIVHDFYEVETANYVRLNSFLIKSKKHTD